MQRRAAFITRSMGSAQTKRREDLIPGRRGGGRIRIGPLELDVLSRQVWLHGHAVRLSKKEFALLRALAAD